MTLPTDAAARKAVPLATGVLDYFPDALIEIARLSQVGNDQHNPGMPLHWDRAKSGDEADALLRHLLQRGTIDSDGVRHSAKVAWRALALLQKEIEADGAPVARGARGGRSGDVFGVPAEAVGLIFREISRSASPRGGFVVEIEATRAYDAHPGVCGHRPIHQDDGA